MRTIVHMRNVGWIVQPASQHWIDQLAVYLWRKSGGYLIHIRIGDRTDYAAFRR